MLIVLGTFQFTPRTVPLQYDFSQGLRQVRDKVQRGYQETSKSVPAATININDGSCGDRPFFFSFGAPALIKVRFWDKAAYNGCCS